MNRRPLVTVACKVKNCYQQIAVLLIAGMLLNGCEQPKLTPLHAEGTILAFGDSLTSGVGADKSSSYPSVLAQLSGLRVINAGRSGEVTADGLARLAETIDQTTPDLLILLEGGNDIMRNQDLAVTKSNLASMIELAQSRGVEVVLIGVPAKSLFSSAASFYAELAEEYQLVFEDNLIASLLRKSAYKSDAIHFNQRGYRVMADSIHELLVENGAL
jgi:lysophospholipase L1-like esterase